VLPGLPPAPPYFFYWQVWHKASVECEGGPSEI